MLIFNKKLIFKNPPSTQIVIFDETNNHFINELIFKGSSLFTYTMNPENIYITFSMIYYFIKSLITFNFNSIKKRKRKLRALFSELFRHYRLAFFHFMKPKVVITFIDNSEPYHWLCKKYKTTNFFAIQNGVRLVFHLNKGPKHYHMHYFCFGDYEKDLFNKFNHKVEQYIPVGSLLAGYYMSTSSSSSQIKYDICVFSSIIHKNYFDPQLKDFWESYKLMNKYLARYITEYEIKFAIATRNKFNTDLPAPGYPGEEAYYRNIYGNNVKLIQRDDSNFISYQTWNESDIVIGSATTTVREAFGWGKKVCYCDFTETKKYHDYDSMIMFTTPNYEDFKSHINKLRFEPQEKYNKRTKKYASYLMNNDPDYPPHIYIRKKIEEYL